MFVFFCFFSIKLFKLNEFLKFSNVNLCENFNNVTVEWKPNIQIISDIKLFLEELKNVGTLDINIYDILVSCGSDLNWSMEYFISSEDIKWFKSEGKIEFMKYINENIIQLNTTLDYNKALELHDELCNLFELQII